VGTHIVWDWNGTLFDDVAAVYGAACEIFAARALTTTAVRSTGSASRSSRA
jgi:hypothetical protein